MVGFGAVSYQPKGAQKPELGTIKVESDTAVSVAERLVQFTPVQVAEVKFSTARRDQTREVVGTITDGIPDQERVIALDRVLAHLDTSKIIPKNVEGVKADPPPIFFSTKPAVLVNVDGDPIWSPIKDNDLKFAVNTNWDLFQHDADQDGSTCATSSRGSRRPTSRDRGRRRASCPRASRSCRPTTTGRRSRPRCRQERSTNRHAEGLRQHRSRPR